MFDHCFLLHSGSNRNVRSTMCGRCSLLERARANGNAGCRETETGGSHLTIEWNIVDVVCSPWLVCSFLPSVPAFSFSLPLAVTSAPVRPLVSSIAPAKYNVPRCALWLLQLGGFVVRYWSDLTAPPQKARQSRTHHGRAFELP